MGTKQKYIVDWLNEVRYIHRSNETKANALLGNINKMIKSVFNKDFFSIYDGIVEGVDTENGLLSVRIPDLNNSLYEECKILLPCSTDSSAMYPNFKINSTVLVGFKAFSLANPIVLGSTLGNAISIPIESDTISTVNGRCKLTLNDHEITLSNGISTITINDSGISLSGPLILANGEDLSTDDIGEI